MLCHAAICSSGLMLHIAACPDIKGQFDMVMEPSGPMFMVECDIPKIPRNKKATSPRISTALPVVENQEVITE